MEQVTSASQSNQSNRNIGSIISINNHNHQSEKSKSKKNIDPQTEIKFLSHEYFLGKDFINSKSEPVASNDVFKSQIICLFFTTQWCNPSKHFIKTLQALYEEANQGVKTMEIIQITLEKEFGPGDSQDKIEEVRKEEDLKFRLYIQDKPWVFINYLDEKSNKLKEKYCINSVPKLIVLRRDLSVLNEDARIDIIEKGNYICDEWYRQVEV